MFGSLVTTVLVVVVLLQLKRILGFLNLSKVRLRVSEGRPVLRSRVPEHTRQLLDNAAVALSALGFELIGAQAFEALQVCDPRSHTYSDCHWHPEKFVLAVVEPAGALTGQATRVDFVTMFDNGSSLMTVNRHKWEQMPLPDDITVVDALADNLPAQWAYHLKAVARETTSRTIVADRLAVLNRLDEILTPRALQHLQQIGWAREVSPGIYRLTARGAWLYSGQLRRQDKALRGALARPYRHDPAPDTMAVRINEMYGIASNIELGAQPLPSWLKVALFAATLLLSVMALGDMLSGMAVAALVAVMFVHELGHFAAMWAFGYQNLSMFFLPFFGAAASGHKPHAPAWQESIVLLAGPVPGIVLALAATQISSDALPVWGAEFVRSFVAFALLINLFNLLPVGILDGGRLFQLAVLGRFPYARAAFAGLGALVGLLYALYSGSRGLAVAMVITLVGMPMQFKAARVTAAIRQKARASRQKKLSKEEVILALGGEFAHPDFGSTNATAWTQRLGVAKIAYPRLLQGVPAVGTSVLAVLAQGLAFFVPIVLIAWSLLQGMQAPLLHTSQAEQQQIEMQRASSPEAIAARAARDEFMARYAAESDPVAKWAMLGQNDEEEDADEDSTGNAAPVDLDPAWVKEQRTDLVVQLPPGHPGRLRYMLETASAANPQAGDAVLNVITELSGGDVQAAAKLDPGRFSLLMDAYGRLATVAPSAVAATQAPALDALWAAMDAPDAPNAAGKARIASTRARMAYTSGEQDAAAAWMERYVAAAGARDASAALTQGWFLLDIGHADEALSLAMRHMGTNDREGFGRARWQTLAGWAEMSRGHAREADAYFQAVLADSAARGQAMRDKLPWWQRWTYQASGTMGLGALHMNDATLDHLAALNQYDPEQGARLMAELRKTLSPQAKYDALSGDFESAVYGWGKARAAARDALRKAIYARSEHA